MGLTLLISTVQDVQQNSPQLPVSHPAACLTLPNTRSVCLMHPPPSRKPPPPMMLIYVNPTPSKSDAMGRNVLGPLNTHHSIGMKYVDRSLIIQIIKIVLWGCLRGPAGRKLRDAEQQCRVCRPWLLHVKAAPLMGASGVLQAPLGAGVQRAAQIGRWIPAGGAAQRPTHADSAVMYPPPSQQQFIFLVPPSLTERHQGAAGRWKDPHRL